MNPILFQSFQKDILKKFIKNPSNSEFKKITPYPYTPGLGTEYDLFKEIHNIHNPTKPWGLVSSKFELKCPITIREFYDYASAELDNGADCVFINPMIINEALFLNVWEQGIAVGHSGLNVIQEYLNENKYISNAIMGEHIFAFNNYFIGNKKFWDKYFQYIDTILDKLNCEATSNTPVGIIYSGSGNYHKNKSMSMRPFIIERLFSSFIEKYKYEIKFSYFKYEKSHFILKCGHHYGSTLHKLSILKNKKILDIESLKKWNEIRKKIIINRAVFFGLLHLDDPDESIISAMNEITN